MRVCILYLCLQILVQILWGGRWQLGAGAGAGEDMEHLFSYLSHVGITTKNNAAAGIL